MCPDYAIGGPHRGRGPVLEAYAETGALEVPCLCGAGVGEFCHHDPVVGGLPRRMPCPKRITAAARAQSNAQPPQAPSRIGDTRGSGTGDLRAEK